MLKNRKEVVWLIAAFLMLSAISAYRQISARYFPNDPARPALVYFVYLILLATWWVSIRGRITQQNMRFYLLAAHALMLFGITVRFIQDAILYHNTYLMRVSGYFTIIPLLLIPLFSLYASLGLGKDEDHRINRTWRCLLIPAGVLAIFVLTNESHHFIFRQLNDETQANLYFHPNAGFYALTVWVFSLEIARILLIYYRSRKMEDYPYLKSVPLLIAVFMQAYTFSYASSSFVVKYELIEYSVSLYFLEAMIWESCILIGLVPVNTQYEEVFDRSTVAMRIVDEQGNSYLKSARALELSTEMFDALRQQRPVLTPDGRELHSRAIRGGYSIWQNDVSQTIAVIAELRESAEKLEHQGDIIQQELMIRSDEARVKEQSRIYNQLTAEIGKQLLLIRDLLDIREWNKDEPTLFQTICLIGAYIKRRCNLRLIEQSDGKIMNNDLDLCFHDLIACLNEMGVEAEVVWRTANTLAPEFAIFSLDVFEFLLEYERFEPRAIRVTFETDVKFSVQARLDADAPVKIPDLELRLLNREDYDLSWQPLTKGYQLSVSGGRV